jgi:hypothetical protein
MISTQKFSFLRGEMEPEFDVKHPDFGFLPPPIPPGLVPAPSGGYYQSVRAKTRRNANRPPETWKAKIPEYSQALDKIAAFEDMFDEYDKQEIVTNLCAMSLIRPTHFDLDSGVPITKDRAHILDKEIYDGIVTDWRNSLSKIDRQSIDLTMPINTNLGWPFTFTAREGIRPGVLGLIAMAVGKAKLEGRSLADVYTELSAHFGNPAIVLGTRQQHTGKVLPLKDNMGTHYVRNFEPRVRSIFMGSKVGIVWNRQSTKFLLKAAMGLEPHNQDRIFLKKRIAELVQRKDRTTIAVDVSKFDKGHGGKWLEYFALAAARIIGDAKVKNDFLAEVRMPLMVAGFENVFLTTDPIAPQLPSGVSYTTVCGLFFGDYICRSIAKIAGLDPNRYGQQWDYLNWGDDMVLSFPNQAIEMAGGVDELLEKATKELDLEFTTEPVLRYLGFNYASGKLQTNEGYSFGRITSKLYLPERVKHYPYSLVGHAARLEFSPDAKTVHERVLSLGWHPSLGPEFPFSELKSRLQTALQEIADTPDHLRDPDALNFLTHGVEISEYPNLADQLGVDFDFATYLGGTFDINQPLDMMREDAKVFFDEYSSEIKLVEARGFQAFPVLAQKLQARENLRYEGFVF